MKKRNARTSSVKKKSVSFDRENFAAIDGIARKRGVSFSRALMLVLEASRLKMAGAK